MGCLTCQVSHSLDFADCIHSAVQHVPLSPVFLANWQLDSEDQSHSGSIPLGTFQNGVWSSLRRHTMSSYISFCDISSHWWSMPTSVKWWCSNSTHSSVSCNTFIKRCFPSSKLHCGTVYIGKAGQMLESFLSFTSSQDNNKLVPYQGDNLFF